MVPLTRRFCYAGLVPSAFFFISCLYTTHHFNSGKTLEPGKTRLTIGIGQHKFNNSNLAKGSFNYRFGVAEKLGPFPGVDLGWHLEIPTNPGTMEFDARLAFPAGKNEYIHHSLSGGWGIGMWADNTLFAEYAVSGKIRRSSLFLNIRTTYLATQFFKVFSEDIDKPFTHNQRLIYQAGAGFSYILPDIPVLPDFIIPQLIATWPQIPAGSLPDDIIWDVQWNVNLGTGWRF